MCMCVCLFAWVCMNTCVCVCACVCSHDFWLPSPTSTLIYDTDVDSPPQRLCQSREPPGLTPSTHNLSMVASRHVKALEIRGGMGWFLNGLFTFLRTLYKEVANCIPATSGGRILCCERQNARNELAPPKKQTNKQTNKRTLCPQILRHHLRNFKIAEICIFSHIWWR